MNSNFEFKADSVTEVIYKTLDEINLMSGNKFIVNLQARILKTSKNNYVHRKTKLSGR